MSEPIVHRWAAIEDLPRDWKSLHNPEVSALVHAWQAQAEALREKDSYREFLIRLRRRWAIETGVLERLYSISDGATNTLIEKGLDAALISHDDTDRPPADVLRVIHDQHNAIEGLYAFIGGERPLGTSYIKELHRTLTAHQLTYDAIDSLKNRVTRELPRGEWKLLKNNVEGPEGCSFEFCPPEHVQSEMDLLLEMHHRHEKMGVSPDIEAAWLHHRFTLIHPFTDGNGRVARCLATLVLLKAGWFPLVITRHERAEYIAALRAADAGNESLLIKLFGTLQSKAVRDALSLSEDAIQEVSAIKGILKSVTNKFSKIREEVETQKKQVLTTGDTLQVLATQRLHELGDEIDATIRGEGDGFRAYSAQAPRGDSKANYNYFQIVQCAKALGYFANREVYQAWAALTICTEFKTEVLFAFHGIGRESTGVLVCSPMVNTRQTTDTEDTVIGDIFPLTEEPFHFTYAEDPSDVAKRFRKWLEQCLISGLDRWRRMIGA